MRPSPRLAAWLSSSSMQRSWPACMWQAAACHTLGLACTHAAARSAGCSVRGCRAHVRPRRGGRRKRGNAAGPRAGQQHNHGPALRRANPGTTKPSRNCKRCLPLQPQARVCSRGCPSAQAWRPPAAAAPPPRRSLLRRQGAARCGLGRGVGGVSNGTDISNCASTAEQQVHMAEECGPSVAYEGGKCRSSLAVK
jgi:hypothetical protein